MLEEKIANTGCPKLAVVIDNATRWNSTADMVDVAIKLQKAIDRLVIEDNKLKDWMILPNEWAMLKDFAKLFKVNLYPPITSTRSLQQHILY